MFAYCPAVPGLVREIEDTIPPTTKSNNPADWYSCGAMVVVGWSFSGDAFTPPVPGAPPAPTPQQVLASQATIALIKSDTVVVRCYSADPQVVVPAAWTTYRAALRAICNGTDTSSTTLPTPPSYPEGT